MCIAKQVQVPGGAPCRLMETPLNPYTFPMCSATSGSYVMLAGYKRRSHNIHYVKWPRVNTHNRVLDQSLRLNRPSPGQFGPRGARVSGTSGCCCRMLSSISCSCCLPSLVSPLSISLMALSILFTSMATSRLVSMPVALSNRYGCSV